MRIEKKQMLAVEDEVSCPVDHVKIDENRARLIAFFVLSLVLVFLFRQNPAIIALLLADFSIRILNLNAYSPLALISGVILKQAGVKPKPVDRAPKRFAAFVGVVFLAAILLLTLMHQAMIAAGIAAVLVLFAALESFLGFCAGCHVYTLLLRLKR